MFVTELSKLKRKIFLPVMACVLVAACLALPSTPPAASEPAPTVLLMIEEDGCSWCELWNEEIGGAYHKTSEGRRAPLRRIELDAPALSDLRLEKRALFTPTFILLRHDREVGRIEGYPGEHFFYPLLARLLERADKQTD